MNRENLKELLEREKSLPAKSKSTVIQLYVESFSKKLPCLLHLQLLSSILLHVLV